MNSFLDSSSPRSPAVEGHPLGRYLLTAAGAAVGLFLLGFLLGLLASGTLVRRQPSPPPRSPVEPQARPPRLAAEAIGRLASGRTASEGALEILAYDPANHRLYASSANVPVVRVADIADPARPRWLSPVSIAEWGDGASSVAFANGLLAVAVPAGHKTLPGTIAFFSDAGVPLGHVEVPPGPDMLAFAPDGRTLAVACEGEPDDSARVDPEGTVCLIDLADGVSAVGEDDLAVLDFRAFNDKAITGLHPGLPHSTLAQNIEPEYIAFSPDGSRAYVACQENNALAVIDVPARRVLDLIGLGAKDHAHEGNGIDPSDRDGRAQVRPVPVLGLYQPDGLACFAGPDGLLLVTANEGDARCGAGYDEVARVGQLAFDGHDFGNPGQLRQDAQLGRLKVSRAAGDTDGDGVYEKLYAFGARSVAIWRPNGQLVWDSGDAIERFFAENNPAAFNIDEDDNDSFDARSDDRGPEPETVVVGAVDGRRFAFVALERPGGVMVWDLADPARPVLETYFSTRDLSARTVDDAGDLSPEGMVFIPAAQSPTGRAMLAVAYEVSGSLGLFELTYRPPPGTPAPTDAPPPAGPTSAKVPPAAAGDANAPRVEKPRSAAKPASAKLAGTRPARPEAAARADPAARREKPEPPDKPAPKPACEVGPEPAAERAARAEHPGPAADAPPTARAEVRFIRLKHGGPGWDQEMGPRGDGNLLAYIHKVKKCPVAERTEALAAERLRRFPAAQAPPFVFLTGSGAVRFTKAQRDTLRWYCLQEGGLLFVDHGGGSFHAGFGKLLRQVFPDKKLEAIPNDDPLFRRPFAFPGGAPPLWHHGGYRAMGIRHDGRWVVFYHPGDLTDAWKTGHSGIDPAIAEAAYRLAVNVIQYSFEQYRARHGR